MTDAAHTRRRILDATLAVVAEGGVAQCSVDRIAGAAGCAKGLVNYHFRTKESLLAEAAAALARDRAARRRALFDGPRGTAAVDALWRLLVADARGRSGRAWAAFSGEPATRGPAAPEPAEREALARAAEGALGLGPDALSPALLAAGLEGVELELVRGGPGPAVRDAYDRFWLALLQGL